MLPRIKSLVTKPIPVLLISTIGVFYIYFGSFRSVLPPQVRYFFTTSDFLEMSFSLLVSASLGSASGAVIFYYILSFIATARAFPRNGGQGRFKLLMRRTAYASRIPYRYLKHNQFLIRSGLFLFIFSFIHFERTYYSLKSITLGVVILYASFLMMYVVSFRVDRRTRPSFSRLLFKKPAGVDHRRWVTFVIQSVSLFSLIFSFYLGEMKAFDVLNVPVSIQTTVSKKDYWLLLVGSNGIVATEAYSDDEAVRGGVYFIPSASIVSISKRTQSPV